MGLVYLLVRLGMVKLNLHFEDFRDSRILILAQDKRERERERQRERESERDEKQKQPP